MNKIESNLVVFKFVFDEIKSKFDVSEYTFAGYYINLGKHYNGICGTLELKIRVSNALDCAWITTPTITKTAIITSPENVETLFTYQNLSDPLFFDKIIDKIKIIEKKAKKFKYGGGNK